MGYAYCKYEKSFLLLLMVTNVFTEPEGVANLKVSSLSSTDTAVEKGLKHVRRLRQGSSYIGSRLKARETEYTDNKAHR